MYCFGKAAVKKKFIFFSIGLIFILSSCDNTWSQTIRLVFLIFRQMVNGSFQALVTFRTEMSDFYSFFEVCRL